MATKKPVRSSGAKTAKKATKPAKSVKTPAKTAKKTAPAKASKPAQKPATKKAVPAKTAKTAKPASKVPVKKAAPAKTVKQPAVKPIVKKAETAKSKATIKKEVVRPVAEEVKEVKPKASAPKGKTVEKPAKAAKQEPVKEVKVPKTTVKTVVPYQPEYKPLEQRKENNKNNEPLVRYSDSELNEFRELINKKLEAAKKELAYLQGLITRKDDMGGDETDNRYMTMEDGSMSMEREQLSQMASRQITYIDHLEKALIRIENKTYGICRVTGKLIDKARLRAVPHATLSLEAKLGLVKPSAEQ
ncbi:MAG: TraR/DksA C4-type zinc finger protein [Ilyomonas sp.]